MKKLLLISALLVISYYTSFGQMWNWASIGKGPATGNAVTQDASNNCYVVGWFAKNTMYDTTVLYSTSSTYNNISIVKYNPSGKVAWARQSITDVAVSEGNGVATDASGNVYVTGMAYDTVHFGGLYIHTPHYVQVAFIVKYNPLGQVLWLRQSTGNGCMCNSIAIDKANNIYIAGYFKWQIVLGKDTLKAANDDIFLAKFDSSGNELWAKQSFGSSGTTDQYTGKEGVGVDAMGNVYMTGYFSDTISFGKDTLYPPQKSSSSNVFIVRYDSSGNEIWAKQSKGFSPNATGTSLSCDVNNNIVATGYFLDTLSFGSDTLFSQTVSPNYTPYIIKYNTAGNLLWALAGNNINGGLVYAYTVATDKYNRIYFAGVGAIVVGAFAMAFGNDTVKQKTGGNPAIMAVFDSSGHVLKFTAINNMGGFTDALTVDPDGHNIYLAGGGQSKVIFPPDTVTYTATPEFPVLAKWGGLADSVITMVKETEPLNNMVVFPNPSTGTFTFQFSQSEPIEDRSNIEVYNMLGEKVYSQPLSIVNSQFLIDLNNQASGVYLYRITTKDGNLVSTGKLIKE